jgi:undecaprenyl-diphosphatase
MQPEAPSTESNWRPDAPAEERARLRWLRAVLRDPPRRQRLIFIVCLVALGMFTLLAALAQRLQTLPFDRDVTAGLQGAQLALLGQAMLALSVFGYTPWSYLTAGLGALIVGLRLGWRTGAYLALITALQGLTNLLVKAAVGRPRPLGSLVNLLTVEHGNSFPSGHVMFYTVFFGFILFLAWTQVRQRAARWVAVATSAALVAGIAPSRIYLGAHWLSDVVAAYMLGLIFLAFAIEFYLEYIRREDLPPVQV